MICSAQMLAAGRNATTAQQGELLAVNM